MRNQTLFRELTAAGILLASYPLNWVGERAGLWGKGQGGPVILVHGLGGNRANLLGLATYVRMAGFCNIYFFEYPRVQSVANSAEHLAALVDKVDKRQRRASHRPQPGRDDRAPVLRGIA